MASNTENLNLLMKNPSTDGADTFNVQTMLNENWQKIDNNAGSVAQTLANILKPTTPPIIGLPPSTTPDGMFQALGNTGELHVWRKTVNVDAVIPTENTGTMDLSTSSSVVRYSKTAYISGSSCVISGDIKTLNLPATAQDVSALLGMFIVFSASATSPVYYIVSVSGTTIKYATTQIGKAPLTTYPVSTNPKAYQEGDDAKAAGYVVGDVVTGKFSLGAMYASNGHIIKYADSVTVSDDGTVALSNESIFTVGSDGYTQSQIQAACAGKFIQYYRTSSGSTYPPDSIYPFNSTPSAIVFVPSDVSIVTKVYDDYDCYAIDRYQPVTGYAAIPAGTTIEYLGKLGDKARVQVLSYIGTGTYGSSNPNSLTFDFVPKAVFLFSPRTHKKCFVAYGDTNGYPYNDSPNGKLNVSWDKKKMSWFQYDSADNQLNLSSYKYRAIAIG